MPAPSDSTSTGDRTGEAEPPERLCLEIVWVDGDWSLCEPVESTINAVGKALASLPAFAIPMAQASIALSSDGEVRRLNALYRGIDKPTNVLSFPVPVGPRSGSGPMPFLGDVVLAAETVAREAREQGVPPAHHLAHLVVHGLLHLLGHDHQSEIEAIEMEAVEIETLARLHIENPYAGLPGSVLS